MYKQVSDKLVKWIYNKVSGANARGCVVGMSGGVDSSVTTALCKEAFPNTTIGIHITCDTALRDTEDARLAANQLAVEYLELDAKKTYLSLLNDMNCDSKEMDRLALGNIKPRLRMTILYFQAQIRSYLVVGTANKSEFAVGYFTKHGDGAVDLFPIGNMVKTQVWELADYLGVPKRIINKSPSAGFWPGQTDEAEMGFSYHQLDKILLGEEEDIRIRAMVDRRRIINEHKMKMPPVPRIKI